ncbi:sulfatase-like hydrolase/transferase [Urbifossiella limnaea]|uniref:sulfatase-like hydrolase/transferase n=1 Tax=Urbifossiella limnaea TaxID=2528023 RepID=UPI00192E3836|nr:sulfatase-like hydrolase/transferase [Urbifossiella limnaea]
MRLTDFHVAPMCTPTRGQLMTGLAAMRNGATSVTAGRTFLRPGIPTIAELFGRAGYKTGLFGKWHLGDHYPHRPIDKGFQESVYHLGWGQRDSTPEFDMPLIDGRYFHNGVEKRYRGHCTDFWFESATAWIKERKARGEPFLCYVPTNAPHAPFVELDEYVRPYQGRGPAGFFGMIAHLDKRFGDLDRFLAAEGLRDNTIVIFMTDNGGTAGVATFNAGLRAGKTTYYDGGHRVPCWVRWPAGNLGEPRDVSTPTQNTDILPTLCDFCGVPVPVRAQSDLRYSGVSLAGLLRGSVRELPERTMVVQYGQTPKQHEACVIRGRWRLVKGAELYNTDADRAQATDLAAKHPDVVQRLRADYEDWWKGVEPTITDFVPISLGAKPQPVVEMNCGDWENIYADNTGYVRQAVGGPTGGTWHVKVEEAGEYEFVLRRWPAQTKAALRDDYEPVGAVGAKAKAKTATFPTIARGTVEIAGAKQGGPADPKATGVSVRMTLPAGRTRLKAWFSDAAGTDLCGAFFVTVRKL